MYDMSLIYALLLNRPLEWNIERAQQIFPTKPAPASPKQIWLACL